jgi:nitrite reductase/ring-hydroxylating ferredoxin subunit
MMNDAGALDDFDEGVPTIVRLDGRDIAMVRCGDEIFAVRNVCPHQSESFAGGHVRHALVAPTPVGDLTLADDSPLLVCPVHTWTYSLRSGACSVDPRLRVRVYPVVIRNGRVLVSVES